MTCCPFAARIGMSIPSRVIMRTSSPPTAEVMTGLRVIAVLGVALLAMLAGSVASAQTSATATIDSRSPTLEKVDGGGWTASLGFTNLTNDLIKLTAEPSDTTDTGCNLTLDKSDLPAAEHVAVKVTVPAACNVNADGIDFVISSTANTAPVSFEVAATSTEETSKPDWGELSAFPIALLVLLLAAVLFGRFFRYVQPDPNNPNPPKLHPGFKAPLKYLKETWSFKDSWVSNVTAAGALLTGIFGSSDVVTAFLGKDGKSSVALATVGAAVALAFIAAGPLVLFAMKSREGDFFTVRGLLLASAVTMAGAYGQLWVVYQTGKVLDLDGWENWVGPMALAAAVLLVFYASSSVRATLTQGLVIPQPPAPSDTIRAATMIVEALKALPDVDVEAIQSAIEGANYPAVGTSPGDDYPTGRSAIL